MTYLSFVGVSHCGGSWIGIENLRRGGQGVLQVFKLGIGDAWLGVADFDISDRLPLFDDFFKFNVFAIAGAEDFASP